MVPMHHVSRLAAQNVKVCLGGQAADEIFGGYARYALASPLSVLRNWRHGGAGLARQEQAASGGLFAKARRLASGNLQRQLFDLKNLRRLARSSRYLHDWRRRYFENFAVVPDSDWRGLFADESVVRRQHAFETYSQVLDQSAATDAATKALALGHADLPTGLVSPRRPDEHGLELGNHACAAC